jgi:hypothetical protein
MVMLSTLDTLHLSSLFEPKKEPAPCGLWKLNTRTNTDIAYVWLGEGGESAPQTVVVFVTLEMLVQQFAHYLSLLVVFVFSYMLVLLLPGF